MKKIYLFLAAILVAISAQAWTVYFQKPSDWSTPKVWAWDSNDKNLWGESWSGNKTMTYDSNLGLYVFTETSKANPAGLLFTDGSKQTNNQSFYNEGAYTSSGYDKDLTIQNLKKIYAQTWTVYFTNPNNWEKVYAYAWSNYNNLEIKCTGDWPGTIISKDNTTGMWKAEFTSFPPDKIIFNNGNNGSDNQSNDMTFENGAIYDKDGKTDAEMTDYTVYFQNKNNWEKVYIYTYNPEVYGGWPGKQLTDKTEDGRYIWTYTSKETPSFGGFIFNGNINGGSKEKGDQTPDITNYEEGATYLPDGSTLDENVSGIPEKIYVRGDITDWNANENFVLTFTGEKSSNGEHIYRNASPFADFSGNFRLGDDSADLSSWALALGASSGGDTEEDKNSIFNGITRKAVPGSSTDFNLLGMAYTNVTMTLYYKPEETSYLQFAGTLVAPQKLYVRGNMNGWNVVDEYALTYTETIVNESNQTEYVYKGAFDKLTGDFKIGGKDWDFIDYGAADSNDKEITIGRTLTLRKGGDNIDTGEGGTINNPRVTFYFNQNGDSYLNIVGTPSKMLILGLNGDWSDEKATEMTPVFDLDKNIMPSRHDYLIYHAKLQSLNGTFKLGYNNWGISVGSDEQNFNVKPNTVIDVVNHGGSNNLSANINKPVTLTLYHDPATDSWKMVVAEIPATLKTIRPASSGTDIDDDSPLRPLAADTSNDIHILTLTDDTPDANGEYTYVTSFGSDGLQGKFRIASDDVDAINYGPGDSDTTISDNEDEVKINKEITSTNSGTGYYDLGNKRYRDGSMYFLYQPLNTEASTIVLNGGATTGVEDIAADNSTDNNASEVYYNLQGIRVSNPVKGAVYIRVQGNSVSKQLIK